MKSKPQTIIIQAPQGAGKTEHAEALREYFGCTGIVEGWPGEGSLEPGALHLTNLQGLRVLSLEEALGELEAHQNG